MKITYDELTGDMMIIFSDAKPTKSQKLDDWAVLWTADDGRWVYIQVRDAQRFIDDPRSITYKFISKDAPPAGFIEIDDE